jgi:nitrite reductase (NADH) large subunit
MPLASSVRDSGLDALFTQTTLKQISGFAIVAFVLLGLSFSLNKRWSLLRWFSYGTLRTWHGLLGALSLVGLFVHTGFRLGANLNLVLMCLFLVSSLSGALTGFVSGASSNGTALANALRRCHQITFWPLPVLILFHALASYYF